MPFEKVGVRATIEGVSSYVRDANRIDRSTAGMGRGVQGVASKFNVSTTQALRFGAAIVGVQLGISVMSRSVIALQESTIGAAIAFESSFAGIRKTMQLTEAEFERLARANRDLAKAIPVSVNELNRIGELAGQLGIEGVDNVLKFEDTIAKLAVTTDLSADTAALAFAQFANILQLPRDQIDRLGAAVVGLGNNFATVESKIVDFAQRMAGAGKIAGLTAADVLGIGTAFASVGVEAEAGGTAVQKVLISLQQAVIEGGRELEIFAAVANVAVDEFARLFREDAAEAFTLFVEGLGDIGEQGFEVLEALGLQNQRVIRSFLSVAGASDTLRRAIKEGNNEFAANVALQREAEQRFDTTASKLQLLRNGFIDIGIEAGDALLLGMEPLIDATQEWIDQNGDQFARDLAGGITEAVTAANNLVDVFEDLAAFGPIRLAIEMPEASLLAAAAIAIALGRPQIATALLAASGVAAIAGADEEARARTETGIGLIGAIAVTAVNPVAGLFALGQLLSDKPRGGQTPAEQEIARLGLDFDAVGKLLAEGIIEGFTDEFQRTRLRFTELGAIRLRGLIGATPLDTFGEAIRAAQEAEARGAAAPGEEEGPPRPDIDIPLTAKELERLQREAERARERLRREQLAELDQFGALIITALRRRAEAVLEVELGAIEDERSARQDQFDGRLAFIEALRQALVDEANAERDAALDALQQERRDREDALRDRLREIGDERDAALGAIDAERRAREEALRDRLNEIDAERDAALEAIDAEANRRIEALEAELGLQDAESDTEERARLERAIALSFDAQDRADAEQALRDFERRQRADAIRDEIADIRDAARTEQDVVRDRARAAVDAAKERDRELSELEDARADEIRRRAADQVEIARDRDRELRRLEQDRTAEIREELQTRLDLIAEQAEAAIEIAQQAFVDEIALLDAREEAARLTFEQITSDWALESEARRLIQEEENEAIGKLLDDFVPEWRAAGLSFGEALVEGLKAAGVVAFVAIMFQRLQDLLDTLKTAEDRAREVLGGTAATATGEPISAFPHGGLVGTRGQRVPILVEPGELILNARQQQAIFGAGGAGGVTFERGAFAGMFDGATLTGTVEENERMLERTFERLMDRTLGRGAFTQGVV